MIRDTLSDTMVLYNALALDDRSTVVPSADVIFSQVGDESVLLNTQSGVYYSLDSVGSHIWLCLQSPIRFGDLERLVGNKYDVQAEQLRRDLTDFVIDLERNGLVQSQALDCLDGSTSF